MVNKPMIKPSTKAAIVGGMLGLATLWYLDPLGMHRHKSVRDMRVLYKTHDPMDTTAPSHSFVNRESSVGEKMLGNVNNSAGTTSHDIQKFTKDVQSTFSTDVAPQIDSMISEKTKQKLNTSTQDVVHDITSNIHKKIDSTLRGPHSDLVSDKLHTAADVIAGSVQQYAGSALDSGDTGDKHIQS